MNVVILASNLVFLFDPKVIAFGQLALILWFSKWILTYTLQIIVRC